VECEENALKDTDRQQLKNMINNAEVVSFDIFDTLLFRKVNEPETIFELVGKHFGIHGFRKLRMDEQNEAGRRVYMLHQYPHANIDEIYDVLAEHTEIPVVWTEVKEYEIQMEKDALVANKEMLDIFLYAKSIGKRVVATSDMYLMADTLKEILEANGYVGFDYVYCSADEHKAKFNRELFELVAEREYVSYENILHIGDKDRDDGEYPKSFGIKTFIYVNEADMEKVGKAVSSDVDNGIYKILYNSSKGFWYNLGVEVGGPIYMALYNWLAEKLKDCDKKIYFLSRDGYNLYQIFKSFGHENIEYLYTSRRALTLASITELNENDIEVLPPYTRGQSVGEILDYLCIDRSRILHLREAGFDSFDDIINTDEEIRAFKMLYVYDKEVFLERCKYERDNALKYFDTTGFLKEDSIVFDCGWQGSSQDLLERFKKTVNCKCKHFFYYFGIRNTEKSRKQLHGFNYDTFLFDFYKNYSLQELTNKCVVMYELFFSAPHESVYYYGDVFNVVFEEGAGSEEKTKLLEGILDFVKEGYSFVKKYNVEYMPHTVVGHIQRLIQFPTKDEAVKVGNLHNVDGFARKCDDNKYIAYVTQEQLEANPNTEIYWIYGLLKRTDIPDGVKSICAKRFGIKYPEETPKYHLEDEQIIKSYQRWLRYLNNHKEKQIELLYKPKFSFVIPVYNTIDEQLKECIESVLSQSYDNFELILVDDHSSWENVVPMLRKYESDSRVKVIYRETNGHISVATNNGIEVSDGDYIVFMDCDDIVDKDALYELAKKLNEDPKLDFIYTDEDKITEDGKLRHMPFFKPDWSPDLFMCVMYTNHLATYRASIAKEIGGLRTAYNGSQDYDFTLRFMEKSDNKRVGHIPKILYHWRERKESVAYAMDSKNYASEATRYTKEEYIRRNGIHAHMEYISGISQYRVIYDAVNNPLVSIIIPSKDHFDILKQCINSIKQFTRYTNYEIVVVDNGSKLDNKINIEEYLKEQKVRYIYEKQDFNFSRMCNIGAEAANGEFLLFLNDDIEIFQPDWLERMLGHAQQSHVGAVGAKLFYPDTTIIQHAGVSNIAEGPSHNFMMCNDEIAYYFSWNRYDYNCIAVTGACLLVSVNKFNEVGGFDEHFPIAYNDVKLCFSLHERGYYNVIRNDVAAYHHESLSRGEDQSDDNKLIRLQKERLDLYVDFPDLKGKDPYLNENLHNISMGLDLVINYDELTKFNLGNIEEKGKANIDYINVGDRIQVIGWSFLEDEAHMEELMRYLVFRDPYGQDYIASVFPVYRQDVIERYGEMYKFSGIECILRKTDLRIDIMPYRIGIYTIDRLGNKYIKWCYNTNVIRSPKTRPLALGSSLLNTFEKHDTNSDVQWYLDENRHCGTYHKLKGWAYRRGNNHYQYVKSIVLVRNDGVAYEFEVHNEERLDVAFSFPSEHFLYYTGFICYIYDSMLESGYEYDIVIRLRNQFDKTDIQDVLTGEKIIS
jgi:GT2 family glycosyltransferase/predicted HAD superfamily hydrolase